MDSSPCDLPWEWPEEQENLPQEGICLPGEEDGPANPSGAAPRRARAEDGISLIKSRFFPQNQPHFNEGRGRAGLAELLSRPSSHREPRS